MNKGIIYVGEKPPLWVFGEKPFRRKGTPPVKELIMIIKVLKLRSKEPYPVNDYIYLI